MMRNRLYLIDLTSIDEGIDLKDFFKFLKDTNLLPTKIEVKNSDGGMVYVPDEYEELHPEVIKFFVKRYLTLKQ